MLKIDKAKLKQYQQFRLNPELALFKFKQEIEIEIKKLSESLFSEIKEKALSIINPIIEKKIDSLKSTILSPEEIIKESIFNKISQLKGEKGDTPTKKELLDIINPLIPNAKDGETPTKEELITIIKPLIPIVKDGETPSNKKLLNLIIPLIPKLPDIKDGVTPIPGIDYYTEKEKKEMAKSILNVLNVEKIYKEIENLNKIIEDLKKDKKFGRQRTLHRGGMIYYTGHSIGTGDGATKVFTLPTSPYNSDEIMMHVGTASYPANSNDFSISGTQVTFINAPPSGANVAVTMQS